MVVIPGLRVEQQVKSSVITWSTITTSDSGGPVDISDLKDIVIHVVGSGTAQLQGSNDNTNFVSIGSALAANTLTPLTTNSKYIQFSTIATATVTIVLTGKRF